MGIRNDDMSTISVRDVVETLWKCHENEDDRYEGQFQHMLTFASELTGISEDSLNDMMLDAYGPRRASFADMSENATEVVMDLERKGPVVGMVGNIRDDSAVDESLWGRSVVITKVSMDGKYPVCEIEGLGQALVHVSHLENLRMRSLSREEKIEKLFEKYEIGQDVLRINGDKVFIGDELDVEVFPFSVDKLGCRLPGEVRTRVLAMDIKDIYRFDAFLVGNEGCVCVALEDAHQNMDEYDEPWVVYDMDSNGWFEEDIGTAFGERLRGFLMEFENLNENTLAEKIDNAYMRCDVDNNSVITQEYLKD